jgi:hypothetical protein
MSVTTLRPMYVGESNENRKTEIKSSKYRAIVL